MKKWILAFASLIVAATGALAQADEVSQEARSHAAMMVLVLVVGGMLAVYLLLWFLRVSGRLPEEKPVPKPRWVHPEDENDAG
jgi:hypothetical protein